MQPSGQARRGRALRTPPGPRGSNGKEVSLGAAGSLPGYFSSITMPRWLSFLFVLILGVALGLLYGWVISPVQYVDTTPDTLRADYRADYVLMVAEAYQTEQDASLSARRLAILGSQPPSQIAADGLAQARQYGFADSDLSLMKKLTTAMQAWQPAQSGTTP